MSRSRKKHGIIKDGGGGNFYNRIFRHRNNQLIRISLVHQDFDELDLYKINELVNQWDICDYKFIWDEKEMSTRPDYTGEPMWTEEEVEKWRRKHFNK